MKFCLSFLLLIVFGNVAFAQTKGTPANDTNYVKEFKKVDKPAEFPGGPEGWRAYLEKNLKYPKQAMKKNIQGVVRVQFSVDTSGAVSDVAIMSEPGGGLGEEVVRLISKGPKWIPAEDGGKKVIYRHIQAVTFNLD